MKLVDVRLPISLLLQKLMTLISRHLLKLAKMQ